MFLMLGAEDVVVEMMKKIRCLAKTYGRDAGGQIAVITALIGLPLLLVAAAAVDINRAHSQNSGVRAAIDAAALAAVIPDNMSQAERYVYAQSIFDKNYLGRDAVSLQISGDRERVDIVATSQVPTTISGVLGIDYINVEEQTAAELTRSDIVCVLALDPSGDRAVEFLDQATFNAPACSVQVNSTSPFAMVSGVVQPPNAQSFCVTGISQGQYSPLVKNACSPIADPYADLQPPNDGWCYPKQLVSGYLGLFSDGTETAEVIGNNALLIPGTYCDGLKVSGVNVRFLPGTYIIKDGPLEFMQGSLINGEDVTFVMKGKSKLIVGEAAQVNFKAPSTGPYAGLVFYKVPDVPAVGKKPNLPEAISTVASGGGLSIIGTAYFPTQELSISSDKPVASQSPATSFIAYRLKFSGKSNTQVHVDHEAGGIPPLLPRSDDGARLVR